MFEKDTCWRKIQNFLPEQNRITEDSRPEERRHNRNGMEIRYDEYTPETASGISVVVFHGVGGNGRLLSFIAVPLMRAGYNVICPDLPGYGYTTYDKSFEYSAWIDAGSFIADMELKKKRKVFLFGLSAGGMLAYNVACRIKTVQGLIITNILDNRLQEVRDYSAKNRFHSRIGIKVLGVLSPFLGKIRIPVKAVANMRTIVNHKELLKIMLKDRTGSGSSVSLSFLISMMNLIPLIEPENFDLCPVIMLHPEYDRWTPVEVSRLFFDRIKTEKQLIMLQKAGHFPIESPGLQQLEKACIDFISGSNSAD